MMRPLIILQFSKYRSIPHKGKNHVSSIGHLYILNRLNYSKQPFQVIVKPNVAAVHNHKFPCKVIFFSESDNIRIIRGKWSDLLFINPVVDHGIIWNSLPMKTLFQRLTEVSSDGYNKIRFPTASLVEAHRRPQNRFEPEITGCHDLFRVEILNTVNEFCSKLFLAVYA